MKILVFGTFDIFHEGHRNFLKQARKHGDFLRVVIARDATVLKVKGRLPRYSERERMNTVKATGLANEVVLGSLNDRYDVVREFKPDVICLGYDQRFFIDRLNEKLINFGLSRTKIIRMQPFQEEKYKSSKLRND